MQPIIEPTSGSFPWNRPFPPVYARAILDGGKSPSLRL